MSGSRGGAENAERVGRRGSGAARFVRRDGRAATGRRRSGSFGVPSDLVSDAAFIRRLVASGG